MNRIIRIILGRIALKQHRRFFLFFQRWLRLLAKFLKIYFNLQGCHIEIRGKIGRRGSVRKRKLILRIGHPH